MADIALKDWVTDWVRKSPLPVVWWGGVWLVVILSFEVVSWRLGGPD
jgi:hypothetical protein